MLRTTRRSPREAAARTRRERAHAARGHRRSTLALAVVAVVATAVPTAATARDVGPGTQSAAAATAATATDAAPPRAPEQGEVGAPAAVEDAEAWCDYLSSYYLAFPSPWSARVINCRSTDLSVAPVYADGSLGTCVLAPARHSRHLGGNIVRWVTDVRLC